MFKSPRITLMAFNFDAKDTWRSISMQTACNKDHVLELKYMRRKCGARTTGTHLSMWPGHKAL
jgi:hypothetical protein